MADRRSRSMANAGGQDKPLGPPPTRPSSLIESSNVVIRSCVSAVKYDRVFDLIGDPTIDQAAR